jgi:hypothetical protein
MPTRVSATGRGALRLRARRMQSVTIAKMIGKYTDDQIKWVLTITPEAFGEKKGMLRASMLKSIADFYKSNPEVDRPRFLKVLAGIDLYQLETGARAYVSIKGGTCSAAMVESIDRSYRLAGWKNAA